MPHLKILSSPVQSSYFDTASSHFDARSQHFDAKSLNSDTETRRSLLVPPRSLDTLRRLADSIRKEREDDPVWASDPIMETVFEELPEACKLEMKEVGNASSPPMFPFSFGWCLPLSSRREGGRTCAGGHGSGFEASRIRYRRKDGRKHLSGW